MKNMAPEDKPLHHFSLHTLYIKFPERNTPAETQSLRYYVESDHTPHCTSFMFLTYLRGSAFRAVVSPVTCEKAN